jgi:4-oxalocrotonate tautomerase
VIIIPLVQINMWKGIEEEKIKQLIERIPEVFVEMDIPREAVEVIVHEIPKTHWGIGGVQHSEKFKNR